mgnify:CR=1 FL=1
MTEMNIIIAILLACGLLFFTGGTVGIIRFPDFYSRMHPAGKLDTFGQVMTIGTLALYVAASHGSLLTALKIVLIVVFIFLTSPTATHAIVDAGVRAGLRPWEKQQKGEKADDLAD